jgi:predicted dehydrogenase
MDIMAEPASKPRSVASGPLRVAVVGLGRCWRRRYEPALRGLPRLFRLVAVADASAAEARCEARRLGCDAAAGITVMLERPDVDALLLIDPQWFGLWPLETACRLGKPVFCRGDLLYKDPHVENVLQQVEAARLPVVLGLASAVCAALQRLQELLAGGLGKPRLVIGSHARPARCSGDTREASPSSDCLLAGLPLLLGRCTALLGQPRRVLAAATPAAMLTTVLLEYNDGRAAQLALARTSAARPSWRLQVFAERGTATMEPGQLSWCTPAGTLTQALPRQRSTARRLLTAFHKAVVAGHPPQPTCADAGRLLEWQRLAQRSLAEGGWQEKPH